MSGQSTMMTLMYQGGWVMWALLGFSMVAAAVALERTWVLNRHRAEVGPFLTRLRRAVGASGSLAAGVRLCDETPGPLATVVRVALLRFERSSEEIEQAIETSGRAELRRLGRRLAVLATTASTAPLLGFLGTVTGMMVAFGELVEHGLSNPALVAAGIEEALTTTAAGLVVAIPTQLVYHLLQARLANLAADLETAADHLVEWAAERREATSASG